MFEQLTEFEPDKIQEMSAEKRAELSEVVRWVIKHKEDVFKCGLGFTRQHIVYIKIIGQMLESPGDFGIEVK
jgi:hypothetical protein